MDRQIHLNLKGVLTLDNLKEGVLDRVTDIYLPQVVHVCFTFYCPLLFVSQDTSQVTPFERYIPDGRLSVV